MDINSLSHSKWNCKYHIVFAPKFRRKIAYGQLKQDIANILILKIRWKDRRRSMDYKTYLKHYPDKEGRFGEYGAHIYRMN